MAPRKNISWLDVTWWLVLKDEPCVEHVEITQTEGWRMIAAVIWSRSPIDLFMYLFIFEWTQPKPLFPPLALFMDTSMKCLTCSSVIPTVMHFYQHFFFPLKTPTLLALGVVSPLRHWSWFILKKRFHPVNLMHRYKHYYSGNLHSLDALF